MAYTRTEVSIFLFLVLYQVTLQKCKPEEELRASISVEDQRAYIKISVLLNKAPRLVHQELHRALGNHAYSERRVYELYREFESGTRLTCEDLPRSGRPPDANTPENQEELQRLMSQSRSWAIDDLAASLQMSCISATEQYGRCSMSLGIAKLARVMCHMS
jgi:hypothetical protein